MKLYTWVHECYPELIEEHETYYNLYLHDFLEVVHPEVWAEWEAVRDILRSAAGL